jgi:RNA polymerase sigma factor (sigma-70 family)
MPPPAEGFAARLVLGPALRAQPDRRLVALVRDGYETAFDEIVRRYGGPLRRYAAAIVGVRSEDVTQDAFSKALLALRRDDVEIELRPWLYRIVRNTALNDLRDRPPAAEVLAETLAGGRSPAEELERREELADLIQQLRTLPESQRAAIVMRELEGLSHEEIAAALGLSGGAARQAIHRARTALRNGLGVLLPMPALKALLAGSGSAPVEVAAGAGGAGVALKAATVTVLVAGAVGAGVAIDHGHRSDSRASADAGPVDTVNSLGAAANSLRSGPAGEGASSRSTQESGSQGPGAGRDTSTQRIAIEPEQGHGGRSASPTAPSESGSGARGGKDAIEPGNNGDGGGGSSGKGGEQGSDDSVSGSSSPGEDSGSDGSGSFGGDGGGGEGSNSGSGDGETVPTAGGETANSEGQDSNSGPDSGDGGAEQLTSSDDLRDPHGAGVFSVQEPQP